MAKENFNNAPQQLSSVKFLSGLKDRINNKILIALTALGVTTGVNNTFAQQNLPPTFNFDLEAKGYIGQDPNTAILDIFFVDQNHIQASNFYRYDYTAGIEPFNITPQPLNVTYTMVNDDGQSGEFYRVGITGQPGVTYQFGHIAQSSGGPANSVTGSISFDMNGNPTFGQHSTPPPLDQNDINNTPRLVSTTTTDAPCPLGYGNFTINLAALASSDTAWQEPLDPNNEMRVILTDSAGTQYTQVFQQGTTSVTFPVPAGTYTGLEVNGYDLSNSPYFNSQVVEYLPDTIAGTSSMVTNNPDNTTANFQSPEIVDTGSVVLVEVAYQSETLTRSQGDDLPKALTVPRGTVYLGWEGNIFKVTGLNRPNLGALDEEVNMTIHGCDVMAFSGTIEARTIGTGVDQIDEEMPEFSVYPNPANDFITIEGLEDQSYDYRVRNTNGSLLSNKTDHEGSINVADLPQGIYVIKTLDSDGKRGVSKFMK